MILLSICQVKQTSPDGQETVFGSNFKFTLYFAAPSEEQAIGIKLCQEVYALTQKLGLKSFELVLRLSNAAEKQPRWEKDYIAAQIKQIEAAGAIKKIFVCGAPSMNETFDRAFEDLQSQSLIKRQDIEIL